MEVREAGSSGLKLSVVGFGCWQLGQKGEADYWGTEVSQAMANELVKQAFESGVSKKTRAPHLLPHAHPRTRRCHQLWVLARTMRLDLTFYRVRSRLFVACSRHSCNTAQGQLLK